MQIYFFNSTLQSSRYKYIRPINNLVILLEYYTRTDLGRASRLQIDGSFRIRSPPPRAWGKAPNLNGSNAEESHQVQSPIQYFERVFKPFIIINQWT